LRVALTMHMGHLSLLASRYIYIMGPNPATIVCAELESLLTFTGALYP
jgi:hypothetical protein